MHTPCSMQMPKEKRTSGRRAERRDGESNGPNTHSPQPRIRQPGDLLLVNRRRRLWRVPRRPPVPSSPILVPGGADGDATGGDTTLLPPAGAGCSRASSSNDDDASLESSSSTSGLFPMRGVQRRDGWSENESKNENRQGGEMMGAKRKADVR